MNEIPFPHPPRHLCPICHRVVEETFRGHIHGHMDRTRRSTCPGSYEPFSITIVKGQ